MHHLNFEKVVDKIERKYEAVVRMSVKARHLTDQATVSEGENKIKVTTEALNQYLDENHSEEIKEDKKVRKEKVG